MTGRIAIIDDDEDVRISLSELLSSYGYESLDFASAEAFLSASPMTQADCIISDMHMGGISGIQLAKHLGGALPPFILITAFSSQSLEALAADAGILCVMRKPFGSEELIERLDRIMVR